MTIASKTALVQMRFIRAGAPFCDVAAKSSIDTSDISSYIRLGNTFFGAANEESITYPSERGLVRLGNTWLEQAAKPTWDSSFGAGHVSNGLPFTVPFDGTSEFPSSRATVRNGEPYREEALGSINASEFDVYRLGRPYWVALTQTSIPLEYSVADTAYAEYQLGVDALYYSNVGFTYNTYRLRLDALTYSVVGEGTQSYTLSSSSDLDLSYTNDGTGTVSYSLDAYSSLTYENSSLGTNVYDLLVQSDLSYSNTVIGTNVYDLVSSAALLYDNSGSGTNDYNLIALAPNELLYQNIGTGSNDYEITLSEAPPEPVVPDVGGGTSSDSRKRRFKEQWEVRLVNRPEDQREPEEVIEEAPAVIEPPAPTITVEASPEAVELLLTALAPPEPDNSIILAELAAVQAELAAAQLARALAEEEQAAALLLMQVTARRKRFFLQR